MDNNTKLAIGGCVTAVLLAGAIIAHQLTSDNTKPDLKLGPMRMEAAPPGVGTAPGTVTGPGGEAPAAPTLPAGKRH